MDTNTKRGLFLTAFVLNLAFLVLVLVDYARWDGKYGTPLFIAWAVVIVVSILVALFARTGPTVVREVERVVESRPRRDLEFRAVEPVAAAPASDDGPFTFNGYTLYGRDVELKGGGGHRTIYFFAKKTPKSGSAIPKPAGFHVGVNERTGLPFLKRGSGGDGEDLTPHPDPGYQPQCSALTEDGQQCRNSARHGSKYCASHKGYQPPTAKGIVLRADTTSKVAGRDTKPGFAGDLVKITEKGAQCQALTGAGDQCRNTVVAGSPYCTKHKGYRQPSAVSVVARKDTRPRVRGAEDTKLAVRKPARRGR